MPASANPQIGPGYGDPLGFGAGAFRSQVLGGLILTDRFWTTQADQHPEWWLIGTRRLGTTQLAGFPVTVELEELRVFSGGYWLELRDRWGELIAELNDWSGGRWTETVNEPGELTFSYPRDTSEADSFENPNEVWLYRGKGIYPERAFVIQFKRLIDAETRTVEVSCEGLLAQWGLEVIRSYDSGGSRTVKQILGDWVYGHQLIQPGIYLGTLAPAIGNQTLMAAAENKTLLQALQDLLALYGGYYYVTPQRRLCWKETIGNDLGHVIRYGKNATGIVQEVDYRTVNNRLVVTGVVAGTPATVTVNDLDSQSEFGIRTGFYQAPDVVNAGDLTKLAQAELLRRSRPQETISVGVIDLSMTDLYDYAFEALALDPGSRVSLVSKESETAVTCRVYQVVRDLDDPLGVQIQVGDTAGGVGTTVSYKPKPDFIRAMANVVGYVQKQQQRGAA